MSQRKRLARLRLAHAREARIAAGLVMQFEPFTS